MKLTLLIITLFVSVSLSYTQDVSGTTKENYIWLSAGFGGSTFGISPDISLYNQFGNNIISVRYIYNVDYFALFLSPLESVYDIGVLYGLNTKGSYSFASISLGISYVGGVRRGAFLSSNWFQKLYEKETYSAFGIPAECQLFFTPFSFFGIGITGFADFNSKKSFFGGLLCLQIGKLR